MNVRTQHIGLLALALCMTHLAASSIWADKALPPKPKPVPQPQEAKATYPIKLLPLAGGKKVSQIVIPRNIMKRHKKQAADARKAEAPNGTRGTVMAGLALSMGLCFGGFWLLRRPDGSRRAKGAMVLAACLLPAGIWAAGEAVGNVAPIYTKPQPKPTPAAKHPSVQVVVGEGKAIELRLSPQDVARLLQAYTAAAGIDKEVEKKKVEKSRK